MDPQRARSPDEPIAIGRQVGSAKNVLGPVSRSDVACEDRPGRLDNLLFAFACNFMTGKNRSGKKAGNSQCKGGQLGMQHSGCGLGGVAPGAVVPIWIWHVNEEIAISTFYAQNGARVAVKKKTNSRSAHSLLFIIQ